LFFPKIKKICDSFQISHSDKGAIKNAKRHARILMEKITKVEEDAKSECQKYVKEFTDHYKTMEKSSSEIFGFSDSSSLCLEKAHILPRSFIKKEMLEKYDNIEEYLKIKEQISDIYNILPLDANTHKLYDSYEIY
jgi:hemerythrin-like domain-containing protein